VRDSSTDRGRSVLAASFEQLDLAALGWASVARAAPAEALALAQPARVVRVDRGGRLLVAVGGSEPIQVRDRIRGAQACVGDWVLIVDGVATDLVERRSVVERRTDTASTRPQAFAANVDLVVAVEALVPAVNIGRVARVGALARAGGCEIAVVLTHADQHDDPASAALDLAARTAIADIITTSVVDGSGFDQLRELIRGCTVLLLGASGAGKSSLANELVGDELLAVGGRNASGTGRHTTSTARLVPLPEGGLLVDTPGVRGIGMHAGVDLVAVRPDGLDAIAVNCKFGDCLHEGEPGCAVQAAIDVGDLPADAIDAWKRLEREALRERARSDAKLRHEIHRDRMRSTKAYVTARRRGEFG
jgi:ribosome biogenesis GTPase